MPGFLGGALKTLAGGLGLAGATGGLGKNVQSFFTGSPEKRENVSTLRPEQEPGFRQLQAAGQGRGAGGAFGTSADYYRDLLSNDNADVDAFSAPALRQYNQDIVPGISEQFAGMGSGGLSSSGFRNAQVQGATDLSERLGALRANLRQSGAQGLQNIGQLGLGNFSQNMTTQQGSEGLLSSAAPAFGNAFAQSFGQNAGNWFGGKGNRVGMNSGPYQSGGGAINASPQQRSV